MLSELWGVNLTVFGEQMREPVSVVTKCTNAAFVVISGVKGRKGPGVS
jgi:hypothetical protein